jgi:FKBP-type peptidyl-prolyl cis-trans isomerase SlyD
MTIAQNKIVTIHYNLTDATSGSIIESSDNQPPMAYLHGAHNIIPGLENVLEGKNIGDKVDVTIAPEDGYGIHNEQGIHRIPLDALKEMDRIEVGMVLTTETETGPAKLQITEVTETEVVVDANHPLAGVTLNFKVSVEDVRDATDEEKADGQAHAQVNH